MDKCINCKKKEANVLINPGKTSLIETGYVCSEECKEEALKYLKDSKKKMNLTYGIGIPLSFIGFAMSNYVLTLPLGILLFIFPYNRNIRGMGIRRTKYSLKTSGLLMMMASLLMYYFFNFR